jgi:hypothetical protein
MPRCDFFSLCDYVDFVELSVKILLNFKCKNVLHFPCYPTVVFRDFQVPHWFSCGECTLIMFQYLEFFTTDLFNRIFFLVSQYSRVSDYDWNIQTRSGLRKWRDETSIIVPNKNFPRIFLYSAYLPSLPTLPSLHTHFANPAAGNWFHPSVREGEDGRLGW